MAWSNTGRTNGPRRTAWKRYEIKYGIVNPKKGSDNGTSI